MRSLKVTPSSASADLTMSASRISWNGRTSDSWSDLTSFEIHRRVAWGMVGLLAGRDWIVQPPILVPGRPTSVYTISRVGFTDFRVPFVPGTVLLLRG